MTTTTDERDPNLIFVAMPLNTTPTPQTQAAWDLFAQPIGPYRFERQKVHCYSAAKGRNILTALAVRSKASKVLFVDGDMNWSDIHVLRILQHKELCVGGLYPKKILSLTQHWVAQFLAPAAREDGLWESVEVGAGWLCVDLKLIEQLNAANPALRYLSDDPILKGEDIFDLWSEVVVVGDWLKQDAVWPRRLTEDFAFCWRIRQLGVPVWVDTICQIGHIGPVDFLQVVHMIQQLTGGKPEDHVTPDKGQLPV